MPELPEVETVRAKLAPVLTGRRFDSVEIADPRLVRPYEPAEVAAELTGERVWRLPLDPEYARMIKGRYAQIQNRTERREASAITAAEFLHHFAGDVPWAHLDIAAIGDNAHRAYLDKGGSGFGVRLLTELALSF